MRLDKKLFTSESVTEGHPDKICDRISDSILDCLIAQDKFSRVACETTTTTGMVFVMGEITTEGYCDVPSIARECLRDIGYTKSDYGIDAATCAVITSIHEQSPDIAMGVNNSFEDKSQLGAGDQGMMFGYACSDTPEFMPSPIQYSHSMARKLAEVRKSGAMPFLRPDGKTQVTMAYRDDGTPDYADTILISTQHDLEVEPGDFKSEIFEKVVRTVVPASLINEKTKFYLNPTGRFVVGGPNGDSGLTGRKIIVDTYGGFARHGGGCFSGKDPTKVDRSAAYMARYAAKNLVAAGAASKLEIQLAYAIGVAEPVSVSVDCFGTNNVDEKKLVSIIREVFPLNPSGIISALDLRRPIYKQTSAYGHFGRSDIALPWEAVDRVEAIKALL